MKVNYYKSKSIIVMPIILVSILYLSAVIMGIYLHKNSIGIILTGVIIPFALGTAILIYLIFLIREPKLKFSIDKENIYIDDEIISLRDISYIITRQDFMNLYYPAIIVALKNKTGYKITHVSNAVETVRIIHNKYYKGR